MSHWLENLCYIVEVFDQRGNLLEVLGRESDLDIARRAFATLRGQVPGQAGPDQPLLEVICPEAPKAVTAPPEGHVLLPNSRTLPRRSPGHNRRHAIFPRASSEDVDFDFIRFVVIDGQH